MIWGAGWALWIPGGEYSRQREQRVQRLCRQNTVIRENCSVYSVKGLLALWSQPDSDSKLGHRAVSNSKYLAILCPHFLTSEMRLKSSQTRWELNELIFIKHSEQSLAHGESSSVNCCCDHHFLCNIFILAMTVSLDACPLSHELFLVMSVSSLYLQHPTQGQHTGGPQNVRWGT